MLSDFPIHSTIAVKDLGRARAFYEEKLGFKPASVAPQGVFYNCGGGTRFFVYPSATAGTNQSTYAGWAVSDIAAVMQMLESRGVSFESYDMPGFDKATRIATFGTLRAAWFKDPDGNILGIVQLPATI